MEIGIAIMVVCVIAIVVLFVHLIHNEKIDSMTNREKLEKVRAEIERLKHQSAIDSDRQAERGLQSASISSFGKVKACEELLSFIDSIQKESKECMYSKDDYTDEDRKSLCDGCKEECKFNKKEYSVNNGLDLGCGVIWRDEEPVSEDLEKASFDNAQKNYKEGFRGAAMQAFTEGAQWQRRQDEKNIGELQWNAHAEGWDECKQEMMKDAIDTTIKQGCTELVILIKGLNEDKFSFGDKVKIIVVKED